MIPTQRWLRRCGKVLVAVVSLCVSLGIAEIAARGVFPAYIPRTGNNQMASDPTVGWKRVPLWSEVDGSFQESSPSAARILFMGDSFTDFDQWPEFTLRELSDRGLRSISGAIAGTAGFGTYQEFLVLQKLVPLVKPTVVVLQVHPWNDLRDNINSPPIYYNFFTRCRPYLSAPIAQCQHYWWHHSTLYWLGVRVFEKILLRAISIDKMYQDGIQFPISYSERESWLPFYLPDKSNSPYVEHAWNQLSHILENYKSYLESQQIPFLVLGIENAFSVDQDVQNGVSPPLPDQFEPLLAMRRLSKLAERLHIRFYDATPTLRSAAQKVGEKIYLGPPGNIAGHLTPQGESAVAALAAEHLSAIIAVQPNDASGALSATTASTLDRTE